MEFIYLILIIIIYLLNFKVFLRGDQFTVYSYRRLVICFFLLFHIFIIAIITMSILIHLCLVTIYVCTVVLTPKRGKSKEIKKNPLEC